MNLEDCKKAAAEKAAALIQDGMSVGLGTGSTASYFIKALARRHKDGLKIQTVASSHASYLLAQEGNLPFLDLNTLASIDVYVDGADEIDLHKQMIKGAGGALLREKILFYMSHQILIIVDETKLVSKLGIKSPLPVEIIPFAFKATLEHLKQLGYRGTLRHNLDGSLWITENNNYLFDIQLSPSDKLSQEHERICSIPGVLETGFFPAKTGDVIIGLKDGSVVIQ